MEQKMPGEMRSERLVLRQFTDADAHFIMELLNSEGWKKFIGNRGIESAEDARRYIADTLLAGWQATGIGFYCVETHSDGQPVGMCGLVRRAYLHYPDIGFALLPQYEGRGYAREAARRVLAAAFAMAEIDTVGAIVLPANARSIDLLEALGMHYEKDIEEPGGEILALYRLSR